MNAKLRISLMTATLFATPMLAIAQSNNPTGNMGANRSETAVGANVDKMQKPGMGTADVQPGAKTPMPAAMAKDSTVPGATGKTVVPGSGSTISGNKTATEAAKTGQTNTSSGK
jgi:hypothetical protein